MRRADRRGVVPGGAGSMSSWPKVESAASASVDERAGSLSASPPGDRAGREDGRRAIDIDGERAEAADLFPRWLSGRAWVELGQHGFRTVGGRGIRHAGAVRLMPDEVLSESKGREELLLGKSRRKEGRRGKVSFVAHSGRRTAE